MLGFTDVPSLNMLEIPKVKHIDSGLHNQRAGQEPSEGHQDDHMAARLPDEETACWRFKAVLWTPVIATDHTVTTSTHTSAGTQRCHTVAVSATGISV